ncbi:MAG: BatD family protein [Candidatus Babeliales bacterium]|jgi:hypothetical protein
MGKKIGKIYILILLIGSVCLMQAEPAITCSVMDSNGQQLAQAQVGVPFVVKVVVSDTQQRKLPTPSLKGLEQFDVQGTRSQIGTTVYNQDVTVAQTYFITLLAKTEGDYKIGPATIEIDGAVLSTKSITVTVGQQQKTQAQDSTTFLEMNFTKDQPVYVGQTIDLKIRFYYVDPMLRLAEINQPTFEDFTVLKVEGPATGTAIVKDQQYRYLEWTGSVIPERSGVLKITPTQALYAVPSKRQKGFGIFDDFNSFFSGINQQMQKAYSNGLELEVLPIPEHTPAVTAVGNFISCTAQLNNQKAGQGEATVLTLEIIGSGNFEQLKHPHLVLPEHLMFYESTATIKKVPQGYKKSFEYIIQGSQAGTYTIDSQIFTFFNPLQKTFIDLKTEPLKLIIETIAHQPVIVSTQNNDLSQVPKMTIIKQGMWKKSNQSELSLLVFTLLFLFPLMLYAILFFKQRRDAYFLKNAPELRYQNAFKQARNTLSKARAGQYDVQVYHIFIELFAARLKKAPSEISEELIEATLRNANIKPEDLIKWRLLFAHMTEQAFSSYGTQERNDGLFNQAFYWLSQLEKLL